MSSGEETLTIKQITRELNVDDKTVRRWLKAGLLAFERDFVGHYSVKRSDLDQFVKERKQKGQADTQSEKATQREGRASKS